VTGILLIIPIFCQVKARFCKFPLELHLYQPRDIRQSVVIKQLTIWMWFNTTKVC